MCVTNHPQPDTEALRIELQEAITTFRAQITLLVQIAGVIATADALLLGYGFAQRQSAIFLVASLLPVVLSVVGLEFTKYALPVIYVAMKIEDDLGLHAAPLVSGLARRMFRSALRTGRGLAEEATAEIPELIRGLQPRVMLRSHAAYVMYIVFVIQLSLFLVATFSAGYHFM